MQNTEFILKKEQNFLDNNINSILINQHLFASHIIHARRIHVHIGEIKNSLLRKKYYYIKTK